MKTPKLITSIFDLKPKSLFQIKTTHLDLSSSMSNVFLILEVFPQKGVFTVLVQETGKVVKDCHLHSDGRYQYFVYE